MKKSGTRLYILKSLSSYECPAKLLAVLQFWGRHKNLTITFHSIFNPLDFDDRATINGQFFQNLRSHLVCIAIVFHVVKSSPMTKAELTSCYSSLRKELKTCLSPRFICCQVFTLVTVSAKSNCSRLVVLSTCFVFRSSLSQSWRQYKEWTIDKYTMLMFRTWALHQYSRKSNGKRSFLIFLHRYVDLNWLDW